MAKIPQGIVISSCEATKGYLTDLLASIETKYSIHVSYEGIDRSHGSFEIGAIKDAVEHFDEFIYLHDTCLIKDNRLFDILFNTKGHVFITDQKYHYMGKFVSDDMPNLPSVSNKNEAIQWELKWFPKEASVMKNPLPVHTNVFEDKFGQRRMRLENDYMVKWKGTFFI